MRYICATQDQRRRHPFIIALYELQTAMVIAET